MPLGRLGAVVGGAVAPHHVRGAVAEQVLDIEIARVMGDGLGREGVAEAMGMTPGIPAARPNGRSNCLGPMGRSRTPGGKGGIGRRRETPGQSDGGSAQLICQPMPN